MIASMTGFGSATAKNDRGMATVEVKSLNYRFCDVNIRLPRELSALELTLREKATRRLIRGKADVAVRWEPAASEAAPEIEGEVVVAFYRQWEALRDQNPNLPALDARSLINLPGVMKAGADEKAMADIRAVVEEAFDAALDLLMEARASEGERLAADLKKRAALLKELVNDLDARRGEVVERYRQKLRDRWEEICEGTGVLVDQGRLEAEAMAIADKADVTEELVRLRAHLNAFDELMDPGKAEAAGKPLDFLLQEFFREINTIGSKARDAEITPIVLKAKHELEKMREQAQNLV